MQTIWLYTVHIRSAAKELKSRQARTSPFSCEGLEPGTTGPGCSNGGALSKGYVTIQQIIVIKHTVQSTR